MKTTKKFVVNTIQEIKHAWLKHIIEPAEKLKPSGKSIQSKNSPKMNQMTSCIINKTRSIKNTIFAITRLTISSFAQLTTLLQMATAITTRQNPNRDRFDIQIKKRKGAPNKKLPKWSYNPPQLNPPEVSDSNKGKGRQSLGKKNTPNYLRP